ncbi:MAG: hypothetical protein R6V01_07915 [Thermoplasmatota archaeon]
MTWDWYMTLLSVAIVLLVISWFVALVWLIQLRRKKRAEPSHVELYFDENFRSIIGEWDLVTRDRVKEYKKDIGKRLQVVGKDITALETNKKVLDKRIGGLEKTIARLEGL